MSEEALKSLSDLASEAHAQIQQAHATMNPVIGVRRGMRDSGIPADAMTIDCLRTQRRILMVLHDDQPGILLYQFTKLEDEMSRDFKQTSISNLTAQTLFDWMECYFSEGQQI